MLKDRTTKKWTLDEYHRLGDEGFFSSDDHVELPDGEIVEISPVGVKHKACVRRLTKKFPRLIGDSALLEVQQPLVVGDEESVPDWIYREPKEGSYTQVRAIERGATLEVQHLPQVRLAVEEVLG
ncbi:MAG TPA: Uma2 family endonuclease [Meiothermus sp.]|nr:Uma2 family endonuclease [Meiothermus sp.]